MSQKTNKSPSESLYPITSRKTWGHLNQVDYSASMHKCIFSANKKSIGKMRRRKLMECLNAVYYFVPNVVCCSSCKRPERDSLLSTPKTHYITTQNSLHKHWWGGIHLRGIKNNQMIFVLVFFFYFGKNKTVLTFSISCFIKDKTFFFKLRYERPCFYHQK